MGRRFDVVLLAAAFLSVAGCSETRQEPPSQGFRKEIDTRANAGSLVVMLDKTEIATVDAVRLELVVEGPYSDAPVFPEPGTTWGQWTVVEVSEEERSVLDGGVVRTRKLYTLEPYLAGAYVIPAFAVRFVEPGKKAEEIEVEPIPVVVRSVIEGDPEDAELAEPLGEIFPTFKGFWWVAGGAIGLLLIFCGWVFVSLRRPVASDGGRPDPRRILIGELDRLMGATPVDAERLSAIAGRVRDLPEELGERIEGMAFSEREVGDEAVTATAKELREILVSELKGGGK